MSGLVRIPRQKFLELGDSVKQRIYTDANPLVRWIFWKRLEGLLALASGLPTRRALDFGCGEGAFLPTLCATFARVVGVDLDVRAAESIAKDYRLANLTLVRARAPQLPLADGLFDLVVAADVLEHLPELDSVVEGLERVLAPGGRLVVSAPSENLLYEWGRKIFGFTKPEDHYHVPEDIEAALGRRLRLAGKRYLPVDLREEVSAFVLLAFSKPPTEGMGHSESSE